MKTYGDSKFMKGMVIMEELEMDEEIFKLSNKIIGKWIKVKIEYITLKNNKVQNKKPGLIRAFMLLITQNWAERL
jgi:hypothetical protein